jgi:hypothetical protein
MINTAIKEDAQTRMAIISDKLSGKGWSFNQRVIYLDEDEIKYYSKVPSGFKKNDYHLIHDIIPKQGIPIRFIKIADVAEEWAKKKKKDNLIRLIFPKGAIITYKKKAGEIIRTDKSGNEISLAQVGNPMADKKKVEWVLALKTPYDQMKLRDMISKDAVDEEMDQKIKTRVDAKRSMFEERKLNYNDDKPELDPYRQKPDPQDSPETKKGREGENLTTTQYLNVEIDRDPLKTIRDTEKNSDYVADYNNQLFLQKTGTNIDEKFRIGSSKRPDDSDNDSQEENRYRNEIKAH